MKQIIKLDAIIILIGGFVFLNNWPPTSILNFILFFTTYFLYLWFSQKENSIKNEMKLKNFYWHKKIFLFTLIGLVLGVSLGANILLRSKNPSTYVHDNVWQMEPAIGFLLNGKNPYTENYFGTELEKMHYIGTTTNQKLLNPALFHLIKLPFHLILSVPFYLISNLIFNFYDQRIVYLFLFILSLLLLYELPKKYDDKFSLVAFYAFNPLFLIFFAAGRDDILVLSLIILTVYLLKQNKILCSSLVLALACASKHSAWFLVPFYYLFIYIKYANITTVRWLKIKYVIKKTWPLPVVFSLLILPFILWDARAFYQDIYAYPAGILPTSYPINGYGLSVAFYKLGVVNKITDYLPMWILQIPIVLLIAYGLIKKQVKNNNLNQLIFNYALTIFVFWFFSRFFHDSYLGFVSQLFLIAYFI